LRTLRHRIVLHFLDLHHATRRVGHRGVVTWRVVATAAAGDEGECEAGAEGELGQAHAVLQGRQEGRTKGSVATVAAPSTLAGGRRFCPRRAGMYSQKESPPMRRASQRVR